MESTKPAYPERYKIAVVGAGVAGIVASYLLENRNEVSLYEKNDRLGGHTNTQVIPYGEDRGTAIDTGFIVLNDQTYPHLHRFLERLGVPIESSDMSFSYWNTETDFGYAGTSLRGLFAQKRNLLRPDFYRMLLDMRRFSHEALEALNGGLLSEKSLGEFLESRRFSDCFVENYLLPMGAAIWSTSTRNMLDYPAESLIGFFKNHGLLSLRDRPQWQTLTGRGKSYIDKFTTSFRGRIFKNAKIEWIEEREDRANLRLEDGSEETYDFVVLACHADEAFSLLKSPNERQQRLLSPWAYQENEAFLHWDERAMPPYKNAWASWNFLAPPSDRDEASVFVTYHMNRLQNRKTQRQYFVTLNPQIDLEPDKIIYQTRYTHPLYTLKSLTTQAQLPDLNLNSRILFCGGYFGHGFHEDAVKSGAAVGALFGLDL